MSYEKAENQAWAIRDGTWVSGRKTDSRNLPARKTGEFYVKIMITRVRGKRGCKQPLRLKKMDETGRLKRSGVCFQRGEAHSVSKYIGFFWNCAGRER